MITWPQYPKDRQGLDALLLERTELANLAELYLSLVGELKYFTVHFLIR
jgi:hypothetical protein